MANKFEPGGLTRLPKIGRPKKFESVQELEDMIQDYFVSCFVQKTRRQIITSEYVDEEGETITKREPLDVPVIDGSGQHVYEQVKPFTVTGLALHLGTTRETLMDYEKNPENALYSDTIKRAKSYIQEFVEGRLFASTQVAGAIFALKNNHGWVDRTETDLTSKGEKINPTVIEDKVKGMFENPIEKPALPAPTSTSIPSEITVKENEDSTVNQ